MLIASISFVTSQNEETNPDDGDFHAPPDEPASQATLARPKECNWPAKLNVKGDCIVCNWRTQNLDANGNCRRKWGS